MGNHHVQGLYLAMGPGRPLISECCRHRRTVTSMLISFLPGTLAPTDPQPREGTAFPVTAQPRSQSLVTVTSVPLTSLKTSRIRSLDILKYFLLRWKLPVPLCNNQPWATWPVPSSLASAFSHPRLTCARGPAGWPAGL